MKIKTLLGAALAAGCLVSCSVDDNDNGQVPASETYSREFIKLFGKINANQDWNMVEKKSVNIDVDQPATVKVYELQGGEYRLAANYKNVTKQTITFDGMKGDDTPFVVSIDGKSFAAENGQTLRIENGAPSTQSVSLRATKIPGQVDNFTIHRGGKTEITLASSDVIMKNLAEKNGTNDVIKNGTVAEMDDGRTIVQKGQAINFYPMYWNSKNKHIVGLYYYDDKGEIVRVPMYADKTDSYKDDADKEDLNFYTNKNTLKDYPAETDAEDCWHFTHTYNYAKMTKKWDVKYESGFKFYSRSYTVTPDKNLVAGIYVEVNGEFYYTEKELNPDGKAHFANTAKLNSDGTDKTYTYLCFDDPDTDDKDYNDVVLYTPRQITPVTENEIAWTVACEDLGGTYDYDFNDIIFRVSHVAGNDYATIIPTAAGGTIPAYLYYNETPISEEWHKHFGSAGYDSSTMINTGKGPEETLVWIIRIEGIPTDWSMSAFSSKDGGINVRVKRGELVQTVTAPSKGEAPQMLVLPFEWSWPTELTRITKGYPDFGTWGENYQDNEWVNNKVEENLMYLPIDRFACIQEFKTTKVQ